MPNKIEWVINPDGTKGETWNPITGCTPTSEGCKNCYAKRMAKRLRGRCGYPADDPFKVTFHPDRLDIPLRWKKPRRIFVCSMGDLFHEDVKDEWIDKVFATMLACQRAPLGELPILHTFMLLTKRPKRMANYLNIKDRSHIVALSEARYRGYVGSDPRRAICDAEWPIRNILLGVTCENQAATDERKPWLLKCPAAVRFISAEPLLGPIVFDSLDGIHGVIVGGETGPGARPMHPDWVRSIRDQCAAAGVPFFFKSWGDHCYPDQMLDDTYSAIDRAINLAGNPDYRKPFRVGKKAAGRLLDGREHNDLPGVASVVELCKCGT